MSRDKKSKTATRTKAVKNFIETRDLVQTAISFNIHPKTLRRWIKWYNEGGEDSLNREKTFSRHPRRFDISKEEKIMFLKEKKPAITLSDAEKILKRKGLKVSRKGIWNVWRRYGLTGFVKERFSTNFGEYIAAISMSQVTIQDIREMIRKNEVHKAAQVINALPIFPFSEIIKEIPEHLLSLRRKVDLLTAQFGEIPLSTYRNKAKRLRGKLEKQKLHYSALRAGINEGYALTWLGAPGELLILARILKKRAQGLRDSGLCFALSLFEGQALGTLLRIPEALKYAQKCKIIIRNIENPQFFMGQLAGLYSVLGYYRDAINLTTKALKGAKGEYLKHLHASLAGFLTTSGDYRAALGILRKGKPEEWGFHSRVTLIQAFARLNQGDFQGASALAIQISLQSKKEEIKRFLHLSTFILACCHAAGGNKNKAKQLLKKYNLLLKKYRLEKEYLLRKILLEDISLPDGALHIPNLRLANLFHRAKVTLKAKDYRKALKYARTQKLFGLFERLALFFPEPVIQLLNKGKKPELPKAFLKMPVFQIDSPLYHLGFLGRLQISKGEKSLRGLGLSPKDSSFLIHLSINKTRRILLVNIYENFWHKSKNPSRNLAHLLVRIRRALKLPSHYLSIKEDSLCFDCYFSTDYGEYQEHIAQAKALLRAGEWGFAKREFMQAFKLFRGEPFKKMYDNWSDDKRLEVLFSYETEVIAFAKELLKRERKEEAERLLKKSRKIVPYSDEVAALLE